MSSPIRILFCRLPFSPSLLGVAKFGTSFPEADWVLRLLRLSLGYQPASFSTTDAAEEESQQPLFFLPKQHSFHFVYLIPPKSKTEHMESFWMMIQELSRNRAEENLQIFVYGQEPSTLIKGRKEDTKIQLLSFDQVELKNALERIDAPLTGGLLNSETPA